MTRRMMMPFGRALDGSAVRWPKGPLAARRRTSGSALELWARSDEPYHGATVLDDLTMSVGDAEATGRILARFATIRLVLLVFEVSLTRAQLATERSIASSYVDALPAGDRERRTLGRLLALGARRVRPAIASCALDAAELATRQNHRAGAYWLGFTAYSLAAAAGWNAEALQAARMIERDARAAGATHAERLWRLRALALERDPAQNGW